jgi:predicted dehydrogenase
MQSPVKIVLSGIGNRALPKSPEKSNWLGWVELIKRSPNFQLVGAHDVSPEAIQRLTSRGYLDSCRTYRDVGEMLRQVECDAILVANPAEFHASTIEAAIGRGLHLLVEKPLTTDLAEASDLVARAEQAGLVLAVGQNWRCKDVGRLLHDTIQSGSLGRIGHIFFRYVRDRENPNYPPYIFAEEFPLLYAMGIHHLDLFRYILQDEYVKVSGHSFKPSWTMYQSDTGLNLFFRTSKNIAVVYTGTISSQNRVIPQESLVVEGEKGTLVNESEWLEPPLWFCPKGKKERVDLTQEVADMSVAGQYDIADQYLLDNFYQAILKREKPVCSGRDALHSLAALEAGRLSCEQKREVFLEEII